jgi:hypothetical protein
MQAPLPPALEACMHVTQRPDAHHRHRCRTKQEGFFNFLSQWWLKFLDEANTIARTNTNIVRIVFHQNHFLY